MHLPLDMCTDISLKGEDPYWLFSQYQQGTNILLIDCRPFTDYSRGHIEGAINISVPSSLMLRRLTKGNVPLKNFINTDISKQKYEDRGLASRIVLYDSNSCLENIKNNNLVMYLVNKALEDHSVCLLNGGFRYFEECFPHLCQCGDGEELSDAVFSLANMKITGDIPSPIHITDPNNNRLQPENLMNVKELLYRADTGGPVPIIPRLYLGNKSDASVLKRLKSADITHILNVTHDLPNLFEDDDHFTYLQLPVQDNWDGNLIDLFPSAFSFIEKAFDSGGNVLVHCLGGISRSSTIIIGYLMLKFGYTLNRAYDHVKSKKSNIAPNFNFMGQLQDFERSMCTLRTPNIDDEFAPSPGSTSSEDSHGSC